MKFLLFACTIARLFSMRNACAKATGLINSFTQLYSALRVHAAKATGLSISFCLTLRSGSKS